MKITIVPTPIGWQAGDEDTFDCDQDFDGHKTYSGMYFSDTTREGALKGLEEQYLDVGSGTDDIALQMECSLAILEIKKLLENK